MIEKKVAYIGGCWSTNIGNAFFNLGADYVLKQVFSERNVNMVMDQSAFTPGWKRKNGNIPWAVNYWQHLCVDYVVLLGPVISKYFLPIWKETLDKLKSRGIKYMLLSTGMMKCEEETVNEVKKYFKTNPPFVVTTRDRKTYDTFCDCITNIYDGICFAFFVPDYYTPFKTDFKKSIALNFDKIDEPYIYLNKHGSHNDVQFDFDGHTFGIKYKRFSQIGLKTDRLSDALVYLFSPLPRGKRASKIGEYTILRPDHRYNPMFVRKAFRYGNSFCGDIPHTYANIYANADLTVSDRVHACALTLAYGNSAFLLAKTERSGLLDRVGAHEIMNHPVAIDLGRLKEEKEALINWMRQVEW